MNIHGHTHNHNVNDRRYINLSADQIGYKSVDLIKIIEEGK